MQCWRRCWAPPRITWSPPHEPRKITLVGWLWQCHTDMFHQSGWTSQRRYNRFGVTKIQWRELPPFIKHRYNTGSPFHSFGIKGGTTSFAMIKQDNWWHWGHGHWMSSCWSCHRSRLLNTSNHPWNKTNALVQFISFFHYHRNITTMSPSLWSITIYIIIRHDCWSPTIGWW